MAYKKSEGEALDFLRDLYQEDFGSPGTIELRVKPTTEGPLLYREFTTDPKAITKTLTKYGDRKAEAAVYYGVCRRINRGTGTKENVSSVPAVYVDIDVAKTGMSFEVVVKALDGLPDVLQPSAVIHSGGGLHVYWFFDKPVELYPHHPGSPEWQSKVALCEYLNRRFANHMGGDIAACDVARVLRLPESYNAKRSLYVSKLWSYRWHRHDPIVLKEAIESFDLYLGPNGFVPEDQLPTATHDDVTTYESVLTAGKRGWTARVDDLWQNTRYGAGYPYIGIDEAQLRCSAYMWAFFSEDMPSPEQRRKYIIERIINKTKLACARSGVDIATWNWDKEEAKIARQIDRWVPKWNAVEARRREEKKKEAKERAAKRKALKEAGEHRTL